MKISKKSLSGHNISKVMSVVTWQWHKIIKSTPFCRGLFFDKENIHFYNIKMN